jgi:hypothetical protein
VPLILPVNQELPWANVVQTIGSRSSDLIFDQSLFVWAKAA